MRPETDNYGRLSNEWVTKIAALGDDSFVREAEQTIWLSAYAANNPRSDYHWQAYECYLEAERRGKPHLYDRAWKRAAGD